MRAKYAIIGLALAMACYLFYLMQHLHDPGTTETRLQGLLRAQAAEIVRLKQLLRKSQQQQRSKAAAVPLDAVPQTPPDLAPIVAAGQPPADGGAYSPEENFSSRRVRRSRRRARRASRRASYAACSASRTCSIVR